MGLEWGRERIRRKDGATEGLGWHKFCIDQSWCTHSVAQIVCWLELVYTHCGTNCVLTRAGVCMRWYKLCID